MNIRFADRDDAQDILDILSYYICNTAVLFANDYPEIEDFIIKMENIEKRYPFLVAQENDSVLGFAYASYFHKGSAYDNSVELSIYLRNDSINKGIGTLLYAKLEDLLKKQNIISLYANVAYTPYPDEYLNNFSFIFHERRGFKKVSHFRDVGFKFGKWYDSVWMVKHINPHSIPPRKFKLIGEICNTF